jgi:hypothetical protein
LSPPNGLKVVLLSLSLIPPKNRGAENGARSASAVYLNLDENGYPCINYEVPIRCHGRKSQITFLGNRRGGLPNVARPRRLGWMVGCSLK